jgi:hypothetical protein
MPYKSILYSLILVLNFGTVVKILKTPQKSCSSSTCQKANELMKVGDYENH